MTIEEILAKLKALRNEKMRLQNKKNGADNTNMVSNTEISERLQNR